jgi:glycosyltransferase involved in cell wall biosynthesis
MSSAQPRVLVLSWHPDEGSITAGGLRRAVEVVGRLGTFTQVLVVDCSPTMYRSWGTTNIESTQYSVPRLPRLATLDFRLARLIQWTAATCRLLMIGTRLARRGLFDVIYVPTSELLPCALAGVLLKGRSRRPLVMCNQNIEGASLLRLVVTLHNRADIVTTVSDSLAGSLRQSGVRTRIRVTRNGVPIGGMGERPPQAQKTWDGVFIGRHTQEKGLFDVLDIWEQVLTRSPSARLALVGACQPQIERRIIERCTRSEMLRGHVVKLGVLTEEAKISVLRQSRVLLAPSRVEGWGFVPLEALVCRAPVVCWDLPAYRESLPDVPAVKRVPVGQVGLFAEVVASLLRLSDAQRQELLSSASSPRAISWDDVSRAEWEAVRAAAEVGI